MVIGNGDHIRAAGSFGNCAARARDIVDGIPTDIPGPGGAGQCSQWCDGELGVAAVHGGSAGILL